MARRSLLTRRVIERAAENRIRQAMEEGAFDHLPGLGKAIPDLDEPCDPDWWVKKWMERERLRKVAGELRGPRRS
jgi:hypothetical protein